MQKFLINGGNKLYGKITVDTSKNAILPILAGSIMVRDTVILHNITYHQDVLNMLKILESIGVEIESTQDVLILNSKNVVSHDILNDLAGMLRASIFLLGPMVASFKKVRVAYPGGCAIGSRPIDIHLQGLKKLGVKIIDKHGVISAFGDDMKCGSFYLPFPSVGATENLIMASVFLNGTTKLIGVAKEPEVVDLCNFLNACGAKIFGAGSDEIIIHGVEKLHTCEYTPISDRIVAGTYLFAPLMTGGEVEIENINKEHLKPVLDMLENKKCKILHNGDNKIIVNSQGRLSGFGKVETLPYPFFPTDLQQPFSALASLCDGNTIITENLFENRFNHIPELIKMGANIIVKGRSAFIEGVNKLYGASVNAPDLRGGAALVLAGLCADGYTTVSNIEYIDRGYHIIEQKLAFLGADIKRVEL